MMSKHVTIALAFSLSLLGGCSVSSTDSAAAAQTTSKTSNTALASAWSKAKAGESPATDCARVKGSLINDDSAAAGVAVAQCNFDIPVAYFNTLLDGVDAGDRTCNQFMTTMATQLSALTMSVGGLKRALDNNGAGSADSAATAALSGALTGGSAASAKDKVKAALSRRAIAACPVMKMYMES